MTPSKQTTCTLENIRRRRKGSQGRVIDASPLLVVVMTIIALATGVDGIAIRAHASEYTLHELTQSGVECHEKLSCGECTQSPSCGWCALAGVCLPGNSDGPNPSAGQAANCAVWDFEFCSGESCDQYKTCQSCIKDSMCGWCSDTKKCQEGDTNPTNGNCSNWSRSICPYEIHATAVLRAHLEKTSF
eukprot:GFYU01005831.1.p1 GENE.GFYU01005831.1~~GFYU01005831.1.p1  ORF type:complete len:206 (-),score=1.35 GFYU01005831.1:277-840(-)